MATINVKLPNGESKSIPQGSKIEDLLSDLNIKPEDALAAQVNGKLVDIYSTLQEDSDIEIIKAGTEEGLDLLRHTTAHIMAHAVLRIFKDVEFAIGPTIEDGFYYDFDLEETLTPEHFEAIEREMHTIVNEDIPIRRLEMSKDEALKKLEGQKARFKIELLNEVPEETVSFYEESDFTDWCRGPHLPRTGMLRAFKLLSLAGAYWRGDERRPMLQRIYGTAFFTQKELDDYLLRVEEAKKRDHRKIGKDLGLFSFHDEAPGIAFWHPKGWVLYDAIETYMKNKLTAAGYVQVRTPIILNETLWRQSGHWDNYKDNMYFTEIDNLPFAVKPMNCPGSLLIFKNTLYSYRDLPLRMSELGLVHRHELKGVLSGLFRVRAFVQDDSHIFCTLDQLGDEVMKLIDLTHDIYRDFGFTEYEVELSTRPSKSIGTDEMWTNAEDTLREALETRGIEYETNPGEGAFYGPKIDFHIKDALKRRWQCGTIQVDFSMPERFDLSYIGPDGAKHRPAMIHRAILGSIERFIGVLTEHYGGAFPTWLSPEQVRIIPISAIKFGEYAQSVNERLLAAGLRSSVDERSEKLNYKIREAQLHKVPYMLVVGAKEAEVGAVAVRRRDNRDLGPMDPDGFIKQLLKEIHNRDNQLTVEP
jgi:threonyl-tRNA synthetase